MTAGSTSLPGDVLPQLPVDPGQYLRQQAQLMRSAPVLERAVKLSGSRISVETLGQRLEVEAAKDADVLTIRVVDSTATGPAQLANAVTAAYQDVVAQQFLGVARSVRSRLGARLVGIDAELAARPNDSRLRAQREAVAEQLKQFETDWRGEVDRRRGLLERAAVPKQPIQPSPGRKMTMVIGMLLGLFTSAVLVWWRTRGQGPTFRSSAPEQGTGDAPT